MAGTDSKRSCRDANRRPPPVERSPAGGIVRPARRPPDWTPPGPRCALPFGRPELWPRPGEDLCRLSGEWRILQRLDGHRWSSDDLVTAAVAATCFSDRPPARFVDLGCGIGSVLLLLAWRFPEARGVGIEAQDASAELARRSIAINGVENRCEVRQGDFRTPGILDELDGADLITGTPPYLPRGTGTESAERQRAHCRFEHRGGVEDYIRTAARCLGPDAPFVGSAGAGQRDRVVAAASAAGLALEQWRSVIPREGKLPLFATFVLRRTGGTTAAADDPPLCLRDAQGVRTPEFCAMRIAMGMPP